MKSVIDLTTDGHVHTRLCHHASGDMEEYVEAAVEKGMSRLIFLEHLECGIHYFESTWLTADDFDYYFSEGDRLRKKYQDRIEVVTGMEVGYNPEGVRDILATIERYPCDYLGLSYHFLDIGGHHVNVVSRKRRNMDLFTEYGVEKAVSAYYNGLLQAMDDIPAQVLCHLDAVLRFHEDIAAVDHHGYIAAVLEKAKAKGLALEINTSGFPVRNQPFPAFDIIQKAVRLNIPLVPGSDAHRPGDVARNFSQLGNYLEPLIT